MPAAFNPLDSQLLFALPRCLHKKSGWTEHVPLAMFLVEILRPRVLVELGTQRGVSYLAFCHAVEETKLSTRCCAVDTWKGDAHAGQYDETIYRELVERHRRYESFSSLLRMTFDEALPKIADGSVDLLHIDGLHFYEAVKKDFETWRPKLSERGVVLFHDTVERARDFGVHQLWAELSAQFPSFNFEHGHGLGILAVGPQTPQPILDFLAAANAQAPATRTFFATLGRRVQLEAEKDWLSQQSAIVRAAVAFKGR
jgi:O-antigen biosynthesis protein